MTLGEVLQWLSEHPKWVAGFFAVLPVVAWLVGEMDHDRGHCSPWKYLYSVLIYLVTIPGLFALILTIYLIIIEGRSILSTDILTQIVPILSMILTIWIIRRQVNLDLVPGFDKISGFIAVAAALLILFWMLDKMRIVAFTHFPFHYLLIIFMVLLLLIVLGLKRMRTS